MRVNKQLKKIVVHYLAGLSDREFNNTLADSLDLRRNKNAVPEPRAKRKYTKRKTVAKTASGAKAK